MNYDMLRTKEQLYQNGKHLLSETVLANYETAFEIEYKHNSTAIEGNTLT